MTKDERNLEDLPDLPAAAELELPELPELPEPEDLPELPAEMPPEVPELPREAVRAMAPEPKPGPRPGQQPKPEVPPRPEPPPTPAPKPDPSPRPTPPEVPKTPEPPPIAPPTPPRPTPPSPSAVTQSHPPLPTPPGEADESGAVAAATSASLVLMGAEPASGDREGREEGSQPPMRTLDKAPRHVQLASKIVVVGALLPFMTWGSAAAGGSVWASLAAKAVMIGAAWVWLAQVRHNWGPKLAGAAGKLAELSLRGRPGSEDEQKAARRAARASGPAAIQHPFPTGLHLVSLALVAVALWLATMDPRRSPFGPVGLAETALLGWAAFSYVHIASFERWGSFNPLFPLMFLGMLFAGLMSAFAGFGAEGMWKAFQIVGGLAVAGGGGLAAYSIVEAMMQAKKEGDAKKAAELEKRKAARAARKGTARS